jgi:hydroxymethylpyrimidine/phosphomethylpyrimidine kinase
VQSTLGVQAGHPVEAEVLRQTLDCLDADLPPAGVKIGMVGSEDNTRIISRYIIRLKKEDSIVRACPIVLDPVLVASSGRPLLAPKAIEALKAELLSLVDWVTPNVDELAVLTGLAIRTREELAAGARKLQEMAGGRANADRIGVLAKGGHLHRPDDLLLTPEGEEYWLSGERIETSATHGTGCALSSAFLSRLVLGDGPLAAARKAKDYVAGAMRRAPGVGHGKGPMGLLWPLQGEQGR